MLDRLYDEMSEWSLFGRKILKDVHTHPCEPIHFGFNEVIFHRHAPTCGEEIIIDPLIASQAWIFSSIFSWIGTLKTFFFQKYLKTFEDFVFVIVQGGQVGSPRESYACCRS